MLVRVMIAQYNEKHYMPHGPRTSNALCVAVLNAPNQVLSDGSDMAPCIATNPHAHAITWVNTKMTGNIFTKDS